MTHNSGVLSRLTILILFLSSSIQALPGLENTPKDVVRELNQSSIYNEASDAMTNKLPQIAVSKFRALLKTDEHKWSKETRAHLSLALAEALIRSASLGKNSENQAAEALKILQQDEIAKLPSAPIWKAEALATLNRYKDASEALLMVKSDHPLYDEVLITRSRLLIAMTRYDDALSALNLATQSKHQKTRNAAWLLIAEINLSLPKLAAVDTALEKITPDDDAQAKKKEYLQAQLSLQKENATDSISRFLALLDKAKHLTEKLYHSCMLGLADAYTKNNNPDVAISTLEIFITENPSSDLLPEAFNKLSSLISADLPDDHPSITKLRQWSDTAPLEAVVIYPDRGSVQSLPYHQPQSIKAGNIQSLALYHRAIILTKSKSTQSHLRALSLLNQLRTKPFAQNQSPSQIYTELRAASLIDTAYLQLILKQPESAAFTLSLMDSIAPSARLRDEANIVQGLLLNDEGKPELSLTAFRAAHRSTSPQVSSVAGINAGITALKASRLDVFQNILNTTKEQEIRTTLLLERALWQSSQGNINGRNDIEKFLEKSPNHTRTLEARLALSEACMNIEPQDIGLAKEQIKIISPSLSGADQQYRITRVTIKIAESLEKWDDAAKSAQTFITTFPDDPRTPVLILKRGNSLFQNEDYNQARLIFKELASADTDASLSNYANFYSALSARLGGTEQAREESIELFQKVINNKGALAAESRIQQSRILIDLRRYDKAEAALKPLLADKKTSLLRRIDAGILLADSLHRQGATDSKKYEQATVIYNDLLAQKSISLGKRNRLKFLLGKTYDSMGEPEKAFNAYYSVMEKNQLTNGSKTINEEWKWFYQCSFQALSMLEIESRWEAAVKLARNIAKSQGPRSEEATKRADNIAKTHLIWEEKNTPTKKDAKPTKPQ